MKFWAVLVLGLAPWATWAADFTGHWSGSGIMTQKSLYGSPSTAPCSRIEITLEHISDRLTIERYHAVCGQIDSDWGPHSLEIRGTEIFEEGERTGTLEGDLLKTLSSSGGVEYAFNLRLKAEKLETYYGVRNMAGAIVIEGSLDRAN
jgi:hypothetical protein